MKFSFILFCWNVAMVTITVHIHTQATSKYSRNFPRTQNFHMYALSIMCSYTYIQLSLRDDMYLVCVCVFVCEPHLSQICDKEAFF